jgi:hypothetical protein
MLCDVYVPRETKDMAGGVHNMTLAYIFWYEQMEMLGLGSGRM